MLRRLILLLALPFACAPEDKNAAITRGRGLEAVTLPPAGEASVYESAIRAAFDIAPGLVLYMHPRRLPRSAGSEGGEPISAGLASRLRSRGVLQGTCEPTRDAPGATPVCSVAEPGYIIRGSDILRAGKDTLQIYFAAERFATPTGVKQPPFHFEKIYQLVREGQGWRVAREARVAEEKS
jgi:hypothetical protein